MVCVVLRQILVSIINNSEVYFGSLGSLLGPLVGLLGLPGGLWRPNGPNRSKKSVGGPPADPPKSFKMVPKLAYIFFYQYGRHLETCVGQV